MMRTLWWLFRWLGYLGIVMCLAWVVRAVVGAGAESFFQSRYAGEVAEGWTTLAIAFAFGWESARWWHRDIGKSRLPEV
jgi:hypothetical protein